jgi:hypothetical protein
MDALSEEQWAELSGGEEHPWGGIAEHLAWREKERHGGLMRADGALLAHAGTVICEIDVAGSPRFDVVGVGGVFVAPSERRKGLVGQVLEPLLKRMPQGPDRAMLFCREQLMGLYQKHGFSEIQAPVWADQPDGRIEMPLRAMWRPLQELTAWPAGRVDVLGLPF